MPEEMLRRLLDEDLMVPILIAGSIVTCFVIKTIGQTIVGCSRERTRREVAAFISEGSLSPEQGERLLTAGSSRKNV